MSIYIIRRLLLVIPTVFLVSLVVFVSVRFMPGDIVDLLLSEQGSVSVTAHREQIEELLGLNVPAHEQYFRWIRRHIPAREPGAVAAQLRHRHHARPPQAARDPGAWRTRAADVHAGRHSHRHLLFHPPGQRGRLFWPQHSDTRHLGPALLGGHHGHALPVYLLELVAAHRVCLPHRRPRSPTSR